MPCLPYAHLFSCALCSLGKCLFDAGGTLARHLPQRVPAPVARSTSSAVVAPSATAAKMSSLVVPMQGQMSSDEPDALSLCPASLLPWLSWERWPALSPWE